ncbi:hypothetical protein P691DRAFT_772008 [Macrolepiota fuliginosa MF-IS2]|uniref:Uncharacterized protein n=1 Tax=Macrolepiota fuliginosa MF-IS2 TaxID=1400762 RepID=A0A9P5XP91_9AGAR|nr:hypothetical protein P691DRAFT_772008 [Macrolepiota fuliginosa MF-IS2]
MGLIKRTPVSLPPERVHYARAESSSAIGSLHGKPPQTPIIAGSICGGVIIIAWIIGFAVYFRKRYNRKKFKRAVVAAGLPPPEVKSRPETEKVIIPPDPAVLLGRREAGYAFTELAHSPAAVATAEDAELGKDIHSRHSVSGEGEKDPIATVTSEGHERRPLLSVVTDFPDVATLPRQGPGLGRARVNEASG